VLESPPVGAESSPHVDSFPFSSADEQSLDAEPSLPEPIEPFVAEPPSEAWSVESAATSEEIEEPPFQEVTEAAPTIAADILARMGEMPDWDGDPVEPTLARDEVPPANEMFSSPAEIAPRDIGMDQPGPGGDDDESIEDYMARLLQRVSDDDDDSPAVSAPSTGIESVPTSAAPTSAVENTIPEPIQAEPGPQLEYVPRAQAPEQAGKLEAMREVANMSARSAINTHTRMRGGKASHLRLAVALIAMVVGGVLQWISSTTNPGFGQVGLAIIVLGIFWGCQAMPISRACLSDTQRPDAGIAGAGTGNDDNGNLFTDEG